MIDANIYKNAAALLFSNDEDNIEIICCQEWTQEEKESIWEEYFKLMNQAPAKYKQCFTFSIFNYKGTINKSLETRINYKNYHINFYWDNNSDNSVGSFSTNLPLKSAIYFRQKINKYYLDALNALKNIIIKSL